MKKLLAVCIALAMSVTAAAQTVDVTVSLSFPITPSGAALDQMLCSVGVQTVIEGWQMGAQANMTLMPFSPKQLLLTARGVMGDFTIYDQAVIDFANPIQDQLTVSTKYAGFDWAFTFAYSYTLLPRVRVHVWERHPGRLHSHCGGRAACQRHDHDPSGLCQASLHDGLLAAGSLDRAHHRAHDVRALSRDLEDLLERPGVGHRAHNGLHG
jgi:hypothetical protein